MRKAEISSCIPGIFLLYCSSRMVWAPKMTPQGSAFTTSEYNEKE